MMRLPRGNPEEPVPATPGPVRRWSGAAAARAVRRPHRPRGSSVRTTAVRYERAGPGGYPRRGAPHRPLPRRGAAGGQGATAAPKGRGPYYTAYVVSAHRQISPPSAEPCV